MAELKQVVTTYLTDYICDKCGQGEMSPNGAINHEVTPIVYTHLCENCGEAADFPVQYPVLTREKHAP